MVLHTAAAIPRPIEPGEETALLARFHPNGTWRGVIHRLCDRPRLRQAADRHPNR